MQKMPSRSLDFSPEYTAKLLDLFETAKTQTCNFGCKKKNSLAWGF